MLGAREPEIYGTMNLSDIEAKLRQQAPEVELVFGQTNSEDELIGWLQAAFNDSADVILNPAAFTHYSYAMRDAAAMHTAPLIEVHISNPQTREEFRHFSVLAGVADGAIAGFGIDSYRLALSALKKLIK